VDVLIVGANSLESDKVVRALNSIDHSAALPIAAPYPRRSLRGSMMLAAMAGLIGSDFFLGRPNQLKKQVLTKWDEERIAKAKAKRERKLQKRYNKLLRPPQV
jgi:hypothetical protein